MEFYKIQKGVKLSGEEVKAFVDRFVSEEYPSIKDKEDYFLGNNPYILRRNTDASGGAPDWRVRISYARKIINTVAGYLFKPGNIKYNYTKETYRKDIDEIFTRNKEHIKSSQIGKIVSTQGVGYELFLADDNQNPIWIIGDNKEIVPLFTNELDSKLDAFIRFFDVMESKESVRYMDVYYADVIQHFKVVKDKVKPAGPDNNNIYSASGKPPLNIIKNNSEMIGDFEPCVMKNGYGGLIDCYDVMCSDGINEEDRFAWAYMLLSDGLNREDAENVKSRRIFEHLGKDGFVKFLTKDIPTSFFEFMKGWIKQEIHQQTHIPDFLDMSGGPLTGAALDRLLYDFEFLCATKETYFKEGLYNRILMLDSLKNITDAEFVSQDIEIIMQRNRPADNLANAQIASQYKASGLPITDKTLVENFAPFVKNVEEEMEEYDLQVESDIERFGGGPEFVTDEETTDTSENNVDNNE